MFFKRLKETLGMFLVTFVITLIGYLVFGFLKDAWGILLPWGFFWLIQIVYFWRRIW